MEEHNRIFTPLWSDQVFDSQTYKIAKETIKKRWVKQGIWDDRWTSECPGLYRHTARWMHEKRLEPEPDPEAGVGSPLFSFSAERIERQPRRPKTDEEIRLIAERHAARARERDASRPFHQFIYQVSKEREKIEDEMKLHERAAPGVSDPGLPVGDSVQPPQNESNTQGATVATPHDINTMAYERVKEIWLKRGIWYKKWGILPGMSWKHELYIGDLCREEMGDDFARLPADAFQGFLHPCEVTISESPTELSQPSRTPSVSPPPAAFSGVNIFRFRFPSSERESSPADTLARLSNGNTEHTLSLSNSQDHHTTNEGEHSPPPRQRRQRGNRTSVTNKEQGQETVAVATLSPFRPSRISKNPRKVTSASSQRRNLSTLLSEAQRSSDRLEVPANPPQTSPVPVRRSERLQKAKLKTAGKISGSATAGSCVGGSRARPRRMRTGLKTEAFAKPQGVSKTRPKTARRKTR